MSALLKLNLQHVLPNEFEIVYKALLDFKKFGELHFYMKEVTLLEDRSPEYIEYQSLHVFFRRHPSILPVSCSPDHPVAPIGVRRIDAGHRWKSCPWAARYAPA